MLSGLSKNFRSKDTRHFPIREWLYLAADFNAQRILSCVLQEQKEAHFAGEAWGLLAVTYRFGKTQDCLVDQVESEPFSTAESRQQTNLGPIWSNLRLPVMRTECVNEPIGDWALVQTHPHREVRYLWLPRIKGT